MKVKDIVEEVCVLLNLEDVLSLDTFSTSPNATVNPSVSANNLTTRNLNILVRATNLALSEIASMYVPLITTETKTTNNGEILLSSLTKQAIEIVKVENSIGEIAFKTYPTLIDVFNSGTFAITYKYVLGTLAIGDEISNFSAKLTKQLIAFLVASEYCLISSLFEEAKVWEQKFLNGIKKLTNSKEKIVKERRWF